MRSWCLTVAHGLAKAKVPIRIRMDAPNNADLYPYSASAVHENRMGCVHGVPRVPDTKNSRPIWGMGRVPGFALQADSLIGSSPIFSTKHSL